jgi:hypothetical protein
VRPKVVNISKLDKWWMHDDRYVYIGREGKGLSGIFGNPFHLENDRTAVLEQYRQYLEKKIEDEDFKAKVIALKDKILVCFCKPKPCHGDILAEFVERLNAECGN